MYLVREQQQKECMKRKREIINFKGKIGCRGVKNTNVDHFNVFPLFIFCFLFLDDENVKLNAKIEKIFILR